MTFSSQGGLVKEPEYLIIDVHQSSITKSQTFLILTSTPEESVSELRLREQYCQRDGLREVNAGVLLRQVAQRGLNNNKQLDMESIGTSLGVK